MEKVWLLVMNALTVVECLSFCYVVLNKRSREPKSVGVVCLTVVSFILISSIMIWGTDYGLFYLLTFLFVYTLFSKSIIEALKIWFLACAIIIVLESCVGCILTVFSLNISDIELVRVIEYQIIVNVLLWLYYVFIGRRLRREDMNLPKKVWRLLVGILCIITLMMTFFAFIVENVPNIKMVKIGSVFILMGGMAICGMIIAVIYYFNGTEKYRLQNEMAEKYNEQQREYFTRLLEKEQDTKQFRHDIINHLLAMKDIADKEESFVLQEYVQGLLQDINSQKYNQYDIGNDVVNTVLNYYLLPIKDNCIITLNGYMEERGHYDQKDLCTLFSNIIKNAVEAVEKVEETNREIHICVNQGKKYLNIEIENTMCQELVLDENGFPLTSKNDKTNHGLGLQNVKKVVEKYNGTYEIKLEKTTFITEIYLKT
ncbi:MAG: GHKL domain-containing protein [Lachnospiraceae bacterium]|nr:GHKL domain-containing protein [Lachnospiraceae bacterium]